MKIVIAGGTGFIGQYLAQHFTESGNVVKIISRNKSEINWDDEKALADAVDGADCLINLAGKSVDCRYTEANKKLIMESRTGTTRKLQQIADACPAPPKLWINASTATIYRHAEDRAMDEYSGEIGSGFSVDVARAWEAAFFEKQDPPMRKVALRIAIVLGKDAGVMKPYTRLVKYGLGGHQGNGRQMFSWVHITDLYRVINFIIEHNEMEGIYNCAAPQPLPNKDFMKEIRNIIKPVIHLPAPEWMLEAGAHIIKTETELVLKSRWVIPKKLLEKGFVFKYPTIDTALQDLLK